MPPVYHKPMQEYRLWANWMESSCAEKDLGVLVHYKLYQHCVLAVESPATMGGILLLSLILVRLYLKCCVHF